MIPGRRLRTRVGFAAVGRPDLARRAQSDRTQIIAGAATITWRWPQDPTSRRRRWRGYREVRSFTLVYLDATGVGTSTPSAVRSVRIELTTAPTRTAGPPGSDIVSTLTTTVRLRNR
jgi:hypothetical protein